MDRRPDEPVIQRSSDMPSVRSGVLKWFVLGALGLFGYGAFEHLGGAAGIERQITALIAEFTRPEPPRVPPPISGPPLPNVPPRTAPPIPNVPPLSQPRQAQAPLPADTPVPPADQLAANFRRATAFYSASLKNGGSEAAVGAIHGTATFGHDPARIMLVVMAGSTPQYMPNVSLADVVSFAFPPDARSPEEQRVVDSAFRRLVDRLIRENTLATLLPALIEASERDAGFQGRYFSAVDRIAVCKPAAGAAADALSAALCPTMVLPSRQRAGDAALAQRRIRLATARAAIDRFLRQAN